MGESPIHCSYDPRVSYSFEPSLQSLDPLPKTKAIDGLEPGRLGVAWVAPVRRDDALRLPPLGVGVSGDNPVSIGDPKDDGVDRPSLRISPEVLRKGSALD